MLLGAGALSGSGRMDLALAITAAMAATVGADVLWYALGRSHGTRVLGVLCRFSQDADSLIRQAKERFAAHRLRYLILAKFLPGANPLAAGLAGAIPIRPDRFLLYAAAGAFLWAGAWMTLGYLCADIIGLIATRAASVGTPVAIVIVAGLIVYVASKYVRRRRFLRHLRRARMTPSETLGPAVSATVVRDRLIGVAFGLTVFGLLEHVLWPVRAADRMHAQLADVLRSLAAFARVASRPPDDGGDVDARRHLISQQVTDVQGFIESSKFEPGSGAADAQAVDRLTADAQTVFLVVLAIARDAESAAMRPDAVRAATIRVDENVAAILAGLADCVRPGGAAPAIDVNGSLAAFERSLAAQIDAIGEDATYAGAPVLYRELAIAVNRVALSSRLLIPAAMRAPVAR